MKRSRVVGGILLIIIPPLALGLSALILEKMSLDPTGSIDHSHAAGIVTLVLSLLPLLLLLLGFIGLIYVKNRLIGFMFICSCLTFTIVASSITDLRQSIRETAFEAFALRSVPLVRAIHECEQIRGFAPETLGVIVPQYVREIP